MIITSKFNKKGLVNDLSLFLLTVLGMVTFASISGQELVTTIVLAGILLAIAFMIWLFRLKIIVVYEQEIEVRRVCLPFWKHYYRLAEFDSFLLYQSGKTEYTYLLCRGQRVIKLSSDIYENYEELKKILSVIGHGEWGADEARAVDSVFSKKYLLVISCLFLFVLLGVAIPICDYYEKGSVRDSSLVIGLSCATFFFLLSIAALYPCKHITIWRGNLEVKRLLWPFKVKYYSLDEFDYSLEIITKSQYSQEESLWLMREGKLAVSISQSVYSNYDALEHAIGIIPSDTIEMSNIKKIPYYLGKTFNG
jgi:hypothetical protein